MAETNQRYSMSTTSPKMETKQVNTWYILEEKESQTMISPVNQSAQADGILTPQIDILKLTCRLANIHSTLLARFAAAPWFKLADRTLSLTHLLFLWGKLDITNYIIL